MDTLAWLDSLTNFERKVPSKYGETTFSLDRYRTLLDRLGNPQMTQARTVHILGTDGKGSTLAFLESLLLAGGRRTKAFISPHLVSVEERFRIRGESVAPQALIGSLDTIRPVAEDLQGLTYFEALNAAFWVWVEREPPDYVLLETGLGGRLDTTSVCAPTLKILTRLERDHAALLGKTMNKISGEKLASLPSSCPVAIAPQSSFLMDRLKQFAAEKGLHANWVEELLGTEIVSRSTQEWRVRLSSATIAEREFSLGLLGDHQVENFGTALLAFEELGEKLPEEPKAFPIRPDWRGRCQVLSVEAGGTIVLDGSHTAMGGQALRKFLDRIFADRDREFWFACSKDRNPWCYLRGLVRERDRLRLVQYDHPRLWEAEELNRCLVDAGWNDYEGPALEVVSADEVLEEASGLARERVAVVCGSLYWVGGVLGRQLGLRPRAMSSRVVSSRGNPTMALQEPS